MGFANQELPNAEIAHSLATLAPLCYILQLSRRRFTFTFSSCLGFTWLVFADPAVQLVSASQAFSTKMKRIFGRDKPKMTRVTNVREIPIGAGPGAVLEVCSILSLTYLLIIVFHIF
jgi:hypothetical protein